MHLWKRIEIYQKRRVSRPTAFLGWYYNIIEMSSIREPAPIPFIPLEPEQKNIVKSVLMYTNWVSIVLCLFTLVTYATFKRDFPRSMPLWYVILHHHLLKLGGGLGRDPLSFRLSFSALLLHFFLLLGPMGGFSFLDGKTGLCIFQGVFLFLFSERSSKLSGIGIQFSSVLCYCWLCCIAVHL